MLDAVIELIDRLTGERVMPFSMTLKLLAPFTEDRDVDALIEVVRHIRAAGAPVAVEGIGRRRRRRNWR
jgi:hypothetical protein